MAVKVPRRMQGDRPRTRSWLWCALLAGVAVGYGVWASREVKAQKPSQEEVQAAYLYNFGKFVRWPEVAVRGPILVCVAGQDRFAQTVARLVAGEQIRGRRVEVRNLDEPEGAGACSILFVGAQERARTDAFLAAADGKPVLTVGDGPDFLARGGIIQFVPVEDHVRFSVNLEAANRCGVGLSSELLKVAVTVTGKPESGGAPK
ncbi:MAG: YfiR family protein [Acidobacteriaceae bacterium]